jgi:hypothetical protein
MKTLVIKDLVKGTSTNSEALPLFMKMDDAVSVAKETVVLSFNSIEFVSSSFLNSSIGQFIEKHGFDLFSKTVKFADCKTDIAARIKDYVLKYKSLVNS